MSNQPLLPIVSYASSRLKALAAIMALNIVYGGVWGAYAYPGPPEAPEYEVTVIPGPFCGIFGYEPAVGRGINDLGNICGYERNCGLDWEPFFWSPETGRIVLEVPAGFGDGRAQDLNNADQIVGFLRLNFRPQAILWQDDQFIELGVPHGGDASNALSINSKSQVVGYWGNLVAGPSPLAFIWQDGVITDLTPDLGNPRSIANDINDLGMVTGWMGTNENNDAHAFIWHDGIVTDLGVIPGGFTAEGMAINNHRDVAVQGRMLNDNKEVIVRSFLWLNGEWIDLGTLPETTFTRVLAIDDELTIVGYCHNQGLSGIRPFIWQNGVITNVNEVLVSEDEDFSGVSIAWSISDNGQICGDGGHVEFGTVALRLSPILLRVGDLNGDGIVNTTDLLILLGSWGICDGCNNCPADLDESCSVSTTDLLILFANWG